jgi:uncharacterized protein (TIGR03086 family)
MDMDLLDLYRRSSDWAGRQVAGGLDDLEAATPCDDWDVRTLMNHMLDTQSYFLRSARGEDATPPSPTPPDILSDDPVSDFKRMRAEMLETFADPGVIERTGPALGIAFSDQLLHGWDLAQASGQDATMPAGLADAAYNMIHGRFTEAERQGVFKAEIKVSPDATPQERLLAYTGRDPSTG